MENNEDTPPISPLFLELKEEETLTTTQLWKKYYRSPGPAVKALKRLEELGFIKDLNSTPEIPRSKNGGGRGCRYVLTPEGREEYKRQRTLEMLQKLEELSNVSQPLMLLDDFERLLRVFEADTTKSFDELTDSLNKTKHDEYRDTIQKFSTDISSFKYSEERRRIDKLVMERTKEKCLREITELYVKFKEAYLTIKELQSDIEKLKLSLGVFRIGFNTFSEDPQPVSTGQHVYSEPRIFVEHEGRTKSVPISQAQQYLPPDTRNVWEPLIQKLSDAHKQRAQAYTSNSDSSKSAHIDLSIGKCPDLSFLPVAQKHAGTAMLKEFEQCKKEAMVDNIINQDKLVKEIIKHNADNPNSSEQLDTDMERKMSATDKKNIDNPKAKNRH